jgi:hypothetical protein
MTGARGMKFCHVSWSTDTNMDTRHNTDTDTSTLKETVKKLWYKHVLKVLILWYKEIVKYEYCDSI